MDKHLGNLGMGVIFGMLGGNEDSVKAYRKSVGQFIKSITLQNKEDPEYIKVVFESGYAIKILDNGRSCCETRYITTDDDLPYYTGAILNNIKTESAPNVRSEDDYDCHEKEFLRIYTSKGVIVFETHNIHNGYYGGFLIEIEEY